MLAHSPYVIAAYNLVRPLAIPRTAVYLIRFMSPSEAGILDTIWVKRAHRGPMDRRERATLRKGRGIVDNADQGGRRQVTLIEREVWDALVLRFGARIDASARRANLMVSGCSLAGSRGRVLTIGGCRIRIGGEATPCERMDEACPGLREALMPDWRAGAYGEVLDDGEIAVGDAVRWLPAAEAQLPEEGRHA